MASIRAKSVALTGLFIAIWSSRAAAEFAATLVTPRDAALRGSHVAITHEHGYAIMRR